MNWTLFILLLGKTGAPAAAEVLLSQKEALELAFPGGEVIRRNLYLTPEEAAEIERRAQSRLEARLVTYYVGKSSDGTPGYAFFETHVVRTMPETFMAVLNRDGTVRLVEILAFYEPEDYLPPPRWLALFAGKRLDDSLRVKRGLRNISGATLSAHAVTDGVRRIAAIFQVGVLRNGPRPAPL